MPRGVDTRNHPGRRPYRKLGPLEVTPITGALDELRATPNYRLHLPEHYTTEILDEMYPDDPDGYVYGPGEASEYNHSNGPDLRFPPNDELISEKGKASIKGETRTWIDPSIIKK